MSQKFKQLKVVVFFLQTYEHNPAVKISLKVDSIVIYAVIFQNVNEMHAAQICV